MRSSGRSLSVAPYALFAPTLLFLALLVGYPLVQAVGLAFTTEAGEAALRELVAARSPVVGRAAWAATEPAGREHDEHSERERGERGEASPLEQVAQHRLPPRVERNDLAIQHGLTAG